MLAGVDKAIKVIHRNIQRDSVITLYGDYDVDGLCGILCFKTFFELLKYQNIRCVEYSLRTHAIDKKVRSEVLANESSLCIIVDTGSGESDFSELVSLSQLGDVIFADHHENKYDFCRLPPNVIAVNPTVLDMYPHLSGACVAYEICMAYLKKYHEELVNVGEKYLTFFAFSALYADGIYGDNMYCRLLYKKAQNSVLPPIFNNLKYYNISKRFSHFSFAPPLNACFRNGMFYILNSLYLRQGVLSGVDRNNFLAEMEDIRMYARHIVDVLVEKSSVVIIGEFALIDLSGLLNQSIPNKLIWDNKGLVANRIASKYRKCCICIVSTGNRYLLSCRDYYNRNVYQVFSTLYRIGGHKSAFGGELDFHEVLRIRENLSVLTKFMGRPQALNEVPYEGLTEGDIQRIAEENEFFHEKDVKLVRIPADKMEVVWTPESFAQRYEQFKLSLPSHQVVYIKIEPFAYGKPNVLVHFFKSTKLSGSLVEDKGCVVNEE